MRTSELSNVFISGTICGKTSLTRSTSVIQLWVKIKFSWESPNDVGCQSNRHTLCLTEFLLINFGYFDISYINWIWLAIWVWAKSSINNSSLHPKPLRNLSHILSYLIYIPDSNFIDSWREKVGHLNSALASVQLYKTEQKRPNGRVVRSHSVNGQYSRVVCIWMYSQKPTALVIIHQLLEAIRIFSPYQIILWLTCWFKHSDEGDCHAGVLLWWNRVSIAQTSGVTL